ncbi:MAG: cell division protein FtsQ/DivIB [Longimicrobiales bacterium]
MGRPRRRKGTTPRRKKSTQARAKSSGGWRPKVGFIVVLVVAMGGAALFRKVPGLLSGLSIFEIKEVRVQGAQYLTVDEAALAAGIGTGANVWDPKGPWLMGIQSHPLVRTATVRRIPPDVVSFDVEERHPVAFVSDEVLHPVDGAGVRLPIDPTEARLDLPVVAAADSDSIAQSELRTLAEEVGRIESIAPDVYAVISEAVYEDGQIVLRLGDFLTRVRYLPPISEIRLREAMAAMNDWAARFDSGRPREVDLRFDDQVVIRGNQ